MSDWQSGPEWTYDKKVQMGYLKFSDEKIKKTVEGEGRVNLDLNDKGEIVGIEVFL